MSFYSYSISLRDLLTLVGMILQIIGAVAMANSYLGAARRRHWLAILGSALLRGNYARGAVVARDINGDDGMLALQGLALIALGFVLQSVAILFLKG